MECAGSADRGSGVRSSPRAPPPGFVQFSLAGGAELISTCITSFWYAALMASSLADPVRGDSQAALAGALHGDFDLVAFAGRDRDHFGIGRRPFSADLLDPTLRVDTRDPGFHSVLSGRIGGWRNPTLSSVHAAQDSRIQLEGNLQAGLVSRSRSGRRHPLLDGDQLDLEDERGVRSDLAGPLVTGPFSP